MEIISQDELRALKDVAIIIDVRPADEIIKSQVKVEGKIIFHFPLCCSSSISSIDSSSISFLGSLNIVLGPDFVAQVEAQIDKEAVIICHCQRGMRAENAKRALIEAGYTRVLNGENAQRINEAFAD